MTYLIGIDPGISGAIAVLSADGSKIIAVHDMPTVELLSGKSTKSSVSAPMLAAILRKWAMAGAIIEKVSAMPGQGVTSMFNFGKSAGVIEGVCAGLSIPVTLVTPQSWQKRSGKRQGKDGSRARAAELFPADAELFSRVKDDGRAEAVLIARFGICLN
jgi:crossover junction endodeoxyribonuclease RuvC